MTLKEGEEKMKLLYVTLVIALSLAGSEVFAAKAPQTAAERLEVFNQGLGRVEMLIEAYTRVTGELETLKGQLTRSEGTVKSQTEEIKNQKALVERQQQEIALEKQKTEQEKKICAKSATEIDQLRTELKLYEDAFNSFQSRIVSKIPATIK